MKNRLSFKLPNRIYILLLFSFLVILFSFLVYYYYQNEIKQIKKEKGDELKLMAELKINQISDWYNDELNDAESITKNLFYLSNHLEKIITSGDRYDLKQHLFSLKAEHGYKDIFLFTKEGTLIVSTSDTIIPVDKCVIETINEVITSKTAMATDFYKHSDKDYYIDFISPLLTNANSILAVAVFRIDANKTQFPLIAYWPTESKSSETLLIRKEKDSVIFINELRHAQNSALNLKISLNETDVPAVMAINGFLGFYEGHDYRNVEVFAYISPVHDTPWYMVSKVDKDEIFEELYLKMLSVILIVLLFLLFVGMGITFLYEYRKKQLYKALWKAEEEYRTILYSIGDAVIITDREGYIKHLNPIAEENTGWTEKEARDKPLVEVFNVVSEETHKRADSLVSKILKDGLAVGLANHSILISKNGTEIPIADSAAPIKDKNGEISGIVIVFRDQTDERIHQKTLEDNNSFIKSIMDNLPIGIAVNTVKPDGTFNYMNDNFSKIYRTNSEELSNNTFWDCVYEDPVFRNEIKERVINDCDSGDPLRMIWNEIPITRKGQQTTYISARNIQIPDKDLFISTVWDITEQKKAELTIRDNEQKFRSLFENHSSVKLIINPDDGTISDANEAAALFYGWTIEELKQMTVFQINTLSADKLKKEIVKAGSGVTSHFEFKHRLKNGEIRDVEVISSKIDISGKNYLYSLINDITKKKDAEKQIKLLNRSIEQSPVIVIITDFIGNIEYVNPKFSQTTGYTFEEVKGQNMRIFKSGKHDKQFYAEMWKTIASGKNWQGEMQNKKKNGELFWENCLISPITDIDGSISHFIAVKEDITESRKMVEDLIAAKEKAEESDRLKTSFLANMSHEIRTPLNGIIGFIELLQNTDLSTEQHERFNDIIKKSSNRLLSTINDIIEISKIESGQVQINNEKTNINELLLFFLNFFKPEAESKEITLEVRDILPDQYAIINTDRNKLESILVNLIKNALKFTQQGSIHFGCTRRDKLVEFYVKDTGIGIPQERCKAIFERFVQADTTFSRSHEGSGLGLAISKAYAEMLGGDIWVESQQGTGTSFYFNICDIQ